MSYKIGDKVLVKAEITGVSTININHYWAALQHSGKMVNGIMAEDIYGPVPEFEAGEHIKCKDNGDEEWDNECFYLCHFKNRILVTATSGIENMERLGYFETYCFDEAKKKLINKIPSRTRLQLMACAIERWRDEKRIY